MGFRATLLAFGALIAVAAASDVVDATDATFDEIVKEGFVLMEFYAPWCGHCKKLAPEWEKAATELKGKAVVAKMDATQEKQMPEKFGVKGFPTIKVFQDGELSGDYEGGRTAKDIVAYVKGNLGPAVKTPATAEEFTALKAGAPVVVVFFGAEAPEAFSTVAKKLRASVTFAHVADEALFEGSAAGSVKLVKQFDDGTVAYDGAMEEAALQAFVAEESIPLFDEMGPDNYKRYIERKLPVAWLFTPTDGTEAKEACATAAKGFKGKISFVWVDSDKYGGMAQRLGLSGDKFPGFVIDHEGKHFAFPADSAITADAVAEFTTKYVEGTLVATVRSEPAPEPHTTAGLTTVVGNNFEELVSKADQDVFIEFYAPWCGHCKQLAPIYEKVAAALEAKPIRVAKIDATANDYDQESFPVQGFPTMFFVPKGGKPEPYEGGRSEDDLMSFLNGKL